MGKGEWKVAANGCGKFLLRWYYQNQIVDQKPIMTVGVNAATTLKTTKLDNYLKWSGGGMQVDPCVMEFGHKMLERAFQEDIPAGEKALGAGKRLCSWRTSMKASKCRTRQRTMVNFLFFHRMKNCLVHPTHQCRKWGDTNLNVSEINVLAALPLWNKQVWDSDFTEQNFRDNGQRPLKLTCLGDF